MLWRAEQGPESGIMWWGGRHPTHFGRTGGLNGSCDQLRLDIEMTFPVIAVREDLRDWDGGLLPRGAGT